MANHTDVSPITEIYNEAIKNSVATFQIKPKSTEEQLSWFQNIFDQGFFILVAQEKSEVIGWVGISPWSDRCAYSNTGEISTYVASHSRNKGVGRALKTKAIELARERGLHTLISRVAGKNPGNEKLNSDLGFEHMGCLREVGFKFGRFHDVHLFQKML